MGQAGNENYAGKKPVLIVEDNPVNRDLFSLQIQQFGLTTQCATNGKEAVELIQADPDAFSIILMDLQMPVMDGITATQLIREHEANTNTRITIVAFTANGSAGVQNQYIEAGMDDFVNKPSTLAKISDILGKWLRDS